MMACGEARDLMVLYIGGLLDPIRRVELESHVDMCTDCQQEYQVIRLGFQLLSELYPPAEVEVEGFSSKVEGHLPDEPPAVVSAARWWLAGVAGAGLLLGLLASVGSMVGAGRIAETIGPVAVWRMGAAAPSYVGRGARLCPGDEVYSGFEATTALEVGRDIRVIMSQGTVLGLIGKRWGVEADLVLDRGELSVTVPGGKERFSVFTPAGEIRVVGTHFDLTVQLARSERQAALVSIRVLSGKVEWLGEWGLETIAAGTGASGTPGRRPETFSLESAEERAPSGVTPSGPAEAAPTPSAEPATPEAGAVRSSE